MLEITLEAAVDQLFIESHYLSRDTMSTLIVFTARLFKEDYETILILIDGLKE